MAQGLEASATPGNLLGMQHLCPPPPSLNQSPPPPPFSKIPRWLKCPLKLTSTVLETSSHTSSTKNWTSIKPRLKTHYKFGFSFHSWKKLDKLCLIPGLFYISCIAAVGTYISKQRSHSSFLSVSFISWET